MSQIGRTSGECEQFNSSNLSARVHVLHSFSERANNKRRILNTQESKVVFISREKDFKLSRAAYKTVKK